MNVFVQTVNSNANSKRKTHEERSDAKQRESSECVRIAGAKRSNPGLLSQRDEDKTHEISRKLRSSG